MAGGVKRLVIAPHADDEVLGCGGLLAKYPAESAVLVCAQPDPVRMQEMERARTVLGYRTAWCLDLPDTEVGLRPALLVALLDQALDRLQPDEVYLPFPSMHQDHVAVYEAGMRACRLSMSGDHWYPPTVLAYDVAAYDLALYPSDLRWNVFESLSERHVDLKRAALGCYASQAQSGPHPANGLKETAHALGGARRLEYAEQYALVRTVR